MSALSSPVLSAICQIRKKELFRGGNDNKDPNGIYPCRYEYDDLSRLIYVLVGIHPVCLDRGTDLEPGLILGTLRGGVFGDIGVQVIDKKIGGHSCLANCIPIGPTVDLSGWKNGVDAIYDHVKEGGNRYAIMQFAFEYNEEPISRVSRIYYVFGLYENDKPFGDRIEGIIDNHCSDKK